MASAESQVEKGDAAERLLNITLVLLSSRNGLTKAELFQAVRDYRNSIESGASSDAMEKKFDRDKDLLRANGIQLETFILPSDGDDNQQSRYIINPSEFAWPKGIELTTKQLQLLNLASQVWRQASLSSDATAGLDRLRALGVASDSSSLVGFAPRIKTHENCFIPLTNAISERTEITFDYRKPGQDKITKRRVQPWKLRNISGQWLLVCWDVDAQDVRNFMLKRIIGRIKETGATFAKVSSEDIEAAVASLDEHIESQVATLSIRKDSMAWFHYEVRSTADWVEVSFHYMDLWLLAEELRDYAGDFKVIGPAELNDALRVGYEKVAADHG
ncbi:MAG: helix-turn-helix transcriptional regulator [Micrococcales bacterium]